MCSGQLGFLFLVVVESVIVRAGRVASGAAAVVDHHRGDLSIDDLFLAVEVQHVDG